MQNNSGERLVISRALLLKNIWDPCSWTTAGQGSNDLAIAGPGQLVLANLADDSHRIVKNSAFDYGACGLAFDLQNDIFYFTGSENSSSIFSLSLHEDNNSSSSSLVPSRPEERIQSIIFDSKENKIYWADSSLHSIFWTQLSNNISANRTVHTLLTIKEEDPHSLALHQCNKLLFWTNSNHMNPSINRLSLADESAKPQKIVTHNLFQPYGLVLDSAGYERLYWANKHEGLQYSIESCRLDGSDRRNLFTGSFHLPFSLTKIKDIIIWSDWTRDAVWTLNISVPRHKRTEQKFYKFDYSKPYAVLSYPVVHDCSLPPPDDSLTTEASISSSTITSTSTITPIQTPIPILVTSSIDTSSPVSVMELPRHRTENFVRTVVSTTNVPVHQENSTTYMNQLYCLAGGKFMAPESCECPEGFAGSRCEQNLCLNFCLHGGTCTAGMPPMCHCPSGYSGSRCEVNPCLQFCLNGGECQVLLTGKPKCNCNSQHSGVRCEILDECGTNCTNKVNAQLEHNKAVNDTTVTEITSCFHDSTDNLNYIIIALAVVIMLLFIVIGALTWRVVVLSKGPRIRRRIIVSRKEKSVPIGYSGEPGSSINGGINHPNTCEITIENCCNMNICETPCFEPPVRSPSRKFSKKEEKKTLLSNMEDPDSSLEN